ncbi:MAG TPA: RNB domain-containing ribonuclease [Halieaceae bacterium]|nr:RNB domain-containing ribonuclease [Halieaceae bacterium]
MTEARIKPGSLVLYKIRPAVVETMAEKIEIRFEDGKTKRVRDKDIALLHPGPVRDLKDLEVGEGNVEEAWELLQGEETGLAEVAELVYGEYTPASAWQTWQLLKDGLYFEGSIGKLRARRAEAVEKERAERVRKETLEQEWAAFLQRVKQGQLEEQDFSRLGEVERVALGKTAKSRVLSALNVAETPEGAHSFLLRCGYWPAHFNPWPLRQGAAVDSTELPVPPLADEPRRDLTHLQSWAIDDEGNTDPDDAISLDGDRIWVHVADVAALVRPDSHLDLAARARSANLYLPEKMVQMLPPVVTDKLGLGLQEESVALSFGFRLNEDAEVTDIEITPSRIRVTRISYEDAEQRLQDEAFRDLHTITETYRAARLARNAAEINLPEVSVRVVDDEVVIRPLPRLASRQMVTDAMLMAGEAAARFAVQHDIAIPYAVQPEPAEIRQPQSLSEAYAYRRLFKPSNASLSAGRHFGLGLDYYARATSPLRRYVDLVVHQQLRAFVTGKTPLDKERVGESIAQASAVTGVIRRSERLSNLHWKLIYLKEHKDWQGEAVIMALEERKAVVMIPKLAMESRIRRSDNMELDQHISLQLQDVDIPAQTVYFRKP